MPDGLGYVVLDSWGHVWKYGSAAVGYVGDAETPLWVFTDTARDIVIASWMGVGFGYYVLDALGRRVERRDRPAGDATRGGRFADRWRASRTGGKPFVLRNDGVVADDSSLTAQSTTTERSTSPRSILWNASSTCVEGDRLGHEAVEVEATLQVEVDQHREVAARQAVAVPRRLERAAPTEELDHRQLDLHVGSGTPTCTSVPARSRA